MSKLGARERQPGNPYEYCMALATHVLINQFFRHSQLVGQFRVFAKPPTNYASCIVIVLIIVVVAVDRRTV